MANAYVIAKPWPLATAPQVSVQPMKKLTTSVLQTTPVPEGATFEEKYNTLLKDYEDQQYEYTHLEHKMRKMKSEVHGKMLKIQTANNQIKNGHEEIQHTLIEMQMFLSI
jgi:peptidoglycan hydrolase CwlO-like protein